MTGTVTLRLDVGEGVSDGLDGRLVVEEFGDGVPFAGGEGVAGRVGHGDGEALVAVGDGEGFEVDGKFGVGGCLDGGAEGVDVFA